MNKEGDIIGKNINNENEIVTSSFDGLSSAGFYIDVIKKHEDDEKGKVISENRLITENIRKQ